MKIQEHRGKVLADQREDAEVDPPRPVGRAEEAKDGPLHPVAKQLEIDQGQKNDQGVGWPETQVTAQPEPDARVLQLTVVATIGGRHERAAEQKEGLNSSRAPDGWDRHAGMPEQNNDR